MDRAGETTIKLTAHLASLPGGIGCRHLARQRDQFEAGILVSLSLVKPIMSRVPRCEEHGCPLIAGCEHVADFEPESSGNKAGVKYRPTAAGVAATGEPGAIDAAAVALPAAADILAAVDRGPLTIFELDRRLRSEWSHAGEPPDRPELGQIVTILIGVGQIRLDRGVTLVRPSERS